MRRRPPGVGDPPAKSFQKRQVTGPFSQFVSRAIKPQIVSSESDFNATTPCLLPSSTYQHTKHLAMSKTLPSFSLPLGDLPSAYAWTERTISMRSSSTAFGTGINQRDVFGGVPRCIVCGESRGLEDCHIIPKADPCMVCLLALVVEQVTNRHTVGRHEEAEVDTP